MENKIYDISTFLNSDLKLVKLPRKRSKTLDALRYLPDKFLKDTVYGEKEVNGIIKEWIVFDDHVTPRRLLCDYNFIQRDKDGSRYRLSKFDEDL